MEWSDSFISWISKEIDVKKILTSSKPAYLATSLWRMRAVKNQYPDAIFETLIVQRAEEFHHKHQVMAMKIGV